MKRDYFDRLTTKFSFVRSRISSANDNYKIALRGSIEDRLNKIVKANTTEIKYGGMAGGIQVFENFLSPETAKRKMAEALLSHRQCITANAMQGRRYRGTFWLDKAAQWRMELKRRLNNEYQF